MLEPMAVNVPLEPVIEATLASVKFPVLVKVLFVGPEPNCAEPLTSRVVVGLAVPMPTFPLADEMKILGTALAAVALVEIITAPLETITVGAVGVLRRT